MKNIIWISSYPKSGNTWLRALISSYFFSNDGIYKQKLLQNIPEYPRQFFDFISENNLNKEAKQWEIVQSKISSSNDDFIFLKTHSAHCAINNKYKTIYPDFSKCIIYIFRDPRNVYLSLKDFYNFNDEKAKKFIFNNKNILRFRDDSGNEKNFSPILDWQNNIKSYEMNKNKIPTLFVKYEKLVNDPFNEFLNILKFLKSNSLNFEINEIKAKIAVENTSFKKLKDLELKEGFIEKKDTGVVNKKPFFLKGSFRDYFKEIDPEIEREISQNFGETMKNLKYL